MCREGPPAGRGGQLPGTSPREPQQGEAQEERVPSSTTGLRAPGTPLYQSRGYLA